MTFQFARKLLLTFSDNQFTFIGKSWELMVLFFTFSWDYADKKGCFVEVVSVALLGLGRGLARGLISRIPHPLKSGFCFFSVERPIANMQG